MNNEQKLAKIEAQPPQSKPEQLATISEKELWSEKYDFDEAPPEKQRSTLREALGKMSDTVFASLKNAFKKKENPEAAMAEQAAKVVPEMVQEESAAAVADLAKAKERPAVQAVPEALAALDALNKELDEAANGVQLIAAEFVAEVDDEPEVVPETPVRHGFQVLKAMNESGEVAEPAVVEKKSTITKENSESGINEQRKKQKEVISNRLMTQIDQLHKQEADPFYQEVLAGFYDDLTEKIDDAKLNTENFRTHLLKIKSDLESLKPLLRANVEATAKTAPVVETPAPAVTVETPVEQASPTPKAERKKKTPEQEPFKQTIGRMQYQLQTLAQGFDAYEGVIDPGFAFSQQAQRFSELVKGGDENAIRAQIQVLQEKIIPQSQQDLAFGEELLRKRREPKEEPVIETQSAAKLAEKVETPVVTEKVTEKEKETDPIKRLEQEANEAIFASEGMQKKGEELFEYLQDNHINLSFDFSVDSDVDTIKYIAQHEKNPAKIISRIEPIVKKLKDTLAGIKMTESLVEEHKKDPKNSRLSINQQLKSLQDANERFFTTLGQSSSGSMVGEATLFGAAEKVPVALSWPQSYNYVADLHAVGATDLKNKLSGYEQGLNEIKVKAMEAMRQSGPAIVAQLEKLGGVAGAKKEGLVLSYFQAQILTNLDQLKQRIANPQNDEVAALAADLVEARSILARQEQQKQPLVVGVTVNPDGSLNYSKSARMVRAESSETPAVTKTEPSTKVDAPRETGDPIRAFMDSPAEYLNRLKDDTTPNTYSPKKAIGAVLDVFQQLYPDKEQQAKRIQALLGQYDSFKEELSRKKPSLDPSSYENFATNQTAQNLSDSEKKALKKAIEEKINFSQSNHAGGGTMKFTNEYVLGSFIQFLEMIKKPKAEAIPDEQSASVAKRGLKKVKIAA